MTPRINGFHIQYVDDFPAGFVRLAFIFYLAATVLPLFVSSIRRMWVFGALISASCAVTALIYSQYLTSVWCFFAALISVSVYLILAESRRSDRLIPVKIRP